MILAPRGHNLKRRRTIRYIAVLVPVLAASVVVGLLAGPALGITAFTALAAVLLPKPGRFFQLDEKPGRELRDKPPRDEAA
jgi:hypothetical protein